jgi:peptidoglycan/LPS O-acetylase OafA/YrhL
MTPTGSLGLKTSQLAEKSGLGQRLGFLDALRGIASLGVVFYHFCDRPAAARGGVAASLFTDAAHQFHAAVYVFFVLSGFVLPWAMDRSGYRLSHLPKFIAKRLLRLWPPCLLVLLMLGIFFWGEGRTLDVLARELWPQLTYLCGILEKPRYLEILWTLELEIQFYLTIALLFPWLGHASPVFRRVVFAGFCLLPLLPLRDAWVTQFSGIFGLGIAVFWLKSGRCGVWECLSWVGFALCASFAEFTGLNLGTAAATALLLILPPPVPKFLEGLGAISYSLYLIHLFGMQVLGLWLPLHADSSLGFFWRVCLHTLWALFLATLFYWLVERPCQRWAGRLKFSCKNLL